MKNEGSDHIEGHWYNRQSNDEKFFNIYITQHDPELFDYLEALMDYNQASFKAARSFETTAATESVDCDAALPSPRT